MEVNKVYCGDCLEEMKKLPDESVDSIITDPPYNTGMKEVSGKARLCHFFDDNLSKEDYKNLIDNSCREFFRVMKQNTGGYIYINWKKMQLWIDYLQKYGFLVKNVIVWDKVVHGLNYQNYAYTYELIIYFTKGKPNLNNKSPEDNSKGFYRDIWKIKRDMGKSDNIDIHETVKQISVVRLPILHITNKNNLILDPFAGSGTTGVACKQLGRNYILIEKEQKYVDIINKRLKQQTL